jgi:hypothetical protein
MATDCTNVYPTSLPWLAGLILVFSVLTTGVYTSFYVNTVHLGGIYLVALILCLFINIWNVALVIALYSAPVRTSLILVSLALVLTLLLALWSIAIYVKDMDYLSHVEIIMMTVVIATSLVSVVLLSALVGVWTRFKPSPALVCRPFPRKRRTGKV